MLFQYSRHNRRIDNVREIAHILKEVAWKATCSLIDYSYQAKNQSKGEQVMENVAQETEKAISGVPCLSVLCLLGYL